MNKDQRAVTSNQLVSFLNKVVELDEIWLRQLLMQRPACNEHIARHDTIQSASRDDHYVAGVLGLLNGFLGDKDAPGAVRAVLDYKTGRIIRFISDYQE